MSARTQFDARTVRIAAAFAVAVALLSATAYGQQPSGERPVAIGADEPQPWTTGRQHFGDVRLVNQEEEEAPAPEEDAPPPPAAGEMPTPAGNEVPWVESYQNSVHVPPPEGAEGYCDEGSACWGGGCCNDCDSGCCNGGCCNNCCNDDCCLTNLSILVRGGYCSVGTPINSEDAGNWGVTLGKRLGSSQIFAVGGIDSLHSRDSTKILSSAGFLRQADATSCRLCDRFGASFTAQNFYDSFFAGASQWRAVMTVSYALSPTFSVGAYGITPLGRANIDFAPINGGVQLIAPASMSHQVGGFISRNVGPLGANFRLGYGDFPNAIRVGGTVTYAVTSNIALFGSADAINVNNYWGVTCGLQFSHLTWRSSRQSCCDTGSSYAGDLASSRAAGRGDVVRGGDVLTAETLRDSGPLLRMLLINFKGGDEKYKVRNENGKVVKILYGEAAEAAQNADK